MTRKFHLFHEHSQKDDDGELNDRMNEKGRDRPILPPFPPSSLSKQNCLNWIPFFFLPQKNEIIERKPETLKLLDIKNGWKQSIPRSFSFPLWLGDREEGAISFLIKKRKKAVMDLYLLFQLRLPYFPISRLLLPPLKKANQKL